MKAVRESDGFIISANTEPAYTFAKRLRGLTLRKSLPDDSSMHIKPCNSVHCCFMKFAIDVVFLNCDGVITSIINEMKPWTFSKIYSDAESVLELPAGKAAATGLSVGDRLLIG